MTLDYNVPSVILHLFDKYGAPLLQDSSRFESFLRDVIPDKPTEVYLLAISLREFNLTEVTSSSSSNTCAIMLEKLRKKLEEKYQLKNDAINWILSVWHYVAENLQLPLTERKPFDAISDTPNLVENNGSTNDVPITLDEVKRLNIQLTNNLTSLKSEYEKEKKTNEELSHKALLRLKEQKALSIKQMTTIHRQKSWLVALIVALTMLILPAIFIYTPFMGGVYIAPVDSSSFYPSDSTEKYPNLEYYGIAHRANPHNLQISLHASERVWVSYNLDDQVKATQPTPSRTLIPSDQIYLEADDSIYLTIGNAGGLSIIVNGVDIDKLGVSGEVIGVEITYHSHYIEISNTNESADNIYLKINE